jgi:hypothetical protein
MVGLMDGDPRGNNYAMLFFGAVSLIVCVYVLVGISQLLFTPDSPALISSETLIAMLTFILLVVGATNIFFYELAKRELTQRIDREVRKSSENERIAAQVETKTSLAYMLWTLYGKDGDESYINLAVVAAESGLKKAQELDGKIYDRAVLQIENTLAYLLAERQALQKKKGQIISQSDKKRALALVKKIQSLIDSGELEKILSGAPSAPMYSFIETCAWVAFVFAESKEDQEKIKEIMRECIKSAPSEWAANKLERFELR